MTLECVVCGDEVKRPFYSDPEKPHDPFCRECAEILYGDEQERWADDDGPDDLTQLEPSVTHWKGP